MVTVLKKSLFGYKISETNIALDALREENENLNAAMSELKLQLKNSSPDDNTKTSLLEDELRKNKEALSASNAENEELKSRLELPAADTLELQWQKEELYQKNKELHLQNEDLEKQLEELRRQFEELHRQKDELYRKNEESRLQIEELNEKRKELSAHPEDLRAADSSHAVCHLDYDMDKLRRIVRAVLKEHMDDYDRLVREKSTKLQNNIAQCRMEYDKMAQDFLDRSTQYNSSLSALESSFDNMQDSVRVFEELWEE